MSILELYWLDRVNKELMMILGNNIFTNSLIGTTIQDGSKRERSINLLSYIYQDLTLPQNMYQR